VAAIPGLNQKLEDRDAEINMLRRQNAMLEKRLKALELLISSVTEKN
jgi:chaperonin cofactor prefoldin